MGTFAYRGVSRDGLARRGLVEASGIKDARSKLTASGIIAESVVPAAAGRRFAHDLRATVYRELGALLRSGVPLARALDMMVTSPEMARAAGAIAGIRDRVKEGGSLAAALEASGSGVMDLETAVVGAGERAGTLDAVLERLGAFMEEQARLRERVRTALIYPLIVLTVGICVAVVMLEVLIPRVETLVRNSGGELPVLTRLIVSSGRMVPVALPLMLGIAGAGLALARRRARRDDAFRARLDRFRYRLPLAGRAAALLARLRFARTLSLLLQGGVPLIESLELSARATASPWVSAQLLPEIERVRQGGRLSDALRRAGPLAESLPDWVQVGEESGALAGALDVAAERFQELWSRFLTRLLAMLEPAMIIALGAFVLLITLAVLLPIISLTSTVR